MIRFLRLWLVPVIALLMLAGIALAFIPITQRAQESAEAELTLLVDRAFARIGAREQAAEPLIEAQKDGLLKKANAVARFLAHDDTLLAGDALRALCDQLSTDRIDVADAQGTLIASSDEARIGLALGTQESFAWTMAVAGDATLALTMADESTPSVLYACVGRQDIEGFVLLTRDDPYAAEALAASGAETLVTDMPYGEDVLFQAEAAGKDGFFQESGSLCLRKTQDGVTLIAARPISEIFAVRNAMLLAFAVSLVGIAVCAVVSYLLRLEPVITLEEESPALNAAEEPVGLLAEKPEQAEAAREKPHRRGRKQRPDIEAVQAETDEVAKQAEDTEPDMPTEADESRDEPAPRKPGRAGRRKHNAAPAEQREDAGEETFDKIVE
jgi:hypothetical protein